MNSRQQAAHDRLMAALTVRTHLAPETNAKFKPSGPKAKSVFHRTGLALTVRALKGR